MKLAAFIQQRPQSNLLADDKYALPPAKTKTGFLGVFNKRYGGDPRKSLLKVALGAIMDTRSISVGKPYKPTNEDEATKLKESKAQLKTWEDGRASSLFKFTELKKVNGPDPYFRINLPIVMLTTTNLQLVYSLFSLAPVPQDAAQEVDAFARGNADQLFPTKLALSNAGLAPDLETMLSSCLLGVRYKSGNGQCLVSLEFKCTQEEAEHLVSTDWVEIRPVDMFPLVSMWAAAEYVPKFYGKSAISVSKIAETLPAHNEEDVRIDKYGIGIGLDGKPIYLPEKCNNTSKYESMYTSVGANPDGTFSLSSLDPKIAEAKAALPANIPVLIDWVNYKFSYTNTTGRIEVMSLEHVRKCTAAMARNLLGKRLTFSQIANWEGYALRSSVRFTGSSLIMERDLADIPDNDPYAWTKPILQRAMQTDKSFKQIMLEFELEFKQGRGSGQYPNMMEFTTDGSGAFQFIRRFVQMLYSAMVSNLDALYVQYAVSTITENLGWISLLANYGGKMSQTFAEANTATQAAQNQAVDPNWAPPAAPLVTAKFSQEDAGMLPHQAKIRNLLKDSPDFAVLSVAAGGGKSMLSITDVLYEIKANRSAPYLIMCPSHLVANYVAEIVEFTDGGVNVLPITSYNIRTTGYARYEQMLNVAPINTILVVDYDALKFRAKSAVYGTSAIAVYPVIEMLRKFKPGYCMLDESHLLKNSKSARFKSVMSLIADIPKKRIASGTLNPDSPSDLAAQMAILDPTIFGTTEEFNTLFAKGEYSGGRVREWKDNAGEMALAMVKRNCVWAEAKRKEWACALPNREDNFIPVELTDRQKEVYDALFNEMVQSIKKKAQTDKNAQRMLDKLSGKKASKQDEDDFGDMSEESGESDEDLLDDEGDVGAGLQPYLAAIEQFVSDPASHPYAKSGWVEENGTRKEPLTGDDLKAPKTRALIYRLNEWFKRSKSKAIVFVNYQNTAEAIFNSMPPELRDCGILYRASEKTETINRFKKDPKIKWLIGIRKSLEVGLNLQVAGYLARIEGVWTPGEQEQGDSRIARPFFGKGGDKREVLCFDTFVADRTIDVTKAARLRAKIVGLAKFENSKDPNYQDIESIPVFSMTLKNIQTQNDFSSNVKAYADSMSHLNRVIKAEYAEYKEKIEAEGGFKFTQVAKAATPAEARLMARVPYAQGTELYSASELGLVRVDNFLGTEMGGEDGEEEEGGGGEDENEDTGDTVLSAQRNLLVGMRCHTEHGDGEIIGAGAPKGSPYITRLRVRLDDGSTVNRLRSTNVFVVTRSETNSIDLRNKLAKAAGLEVSAPVTVPAVFVKPGKVTQKMLREQEQQRKQKEQEQRKQDRESRKTRAQISVALNLSVINGYMRLGFEPTKNAAAAKALEANGFKAEQPYVRTLIRSHQHLIKQAQLWADNGFNVTSANENETFRLLTDELATKALQTHRHYVRTVGAADFQNYLRKAWKPTADKKLMHLFALVTNGGSSEAAIVNKAARNGEEPAYGAAYLCMPYGGGFPATKNAMRYVATGTRWVIKEGDLSMFVNSTAAVKQILINLRDAGITVSNMDEIRQQAKLVRRVAKIGGVKDDGLDLSVKDDEDEEEAPVKKTQTKPTRPVTKSRK